LQAAAPNRVRHARFASARTPASGTFEVAIFDAILRSTLDQCRRRSAGSSAAPAGHQSGGSQRAADLLE